MPHTIVLYEDARWSSFLPLVYLRPLYQLICGTGTLQERVQALHAHEAPDAVLMLSARPALQAVLEEETPLAVNASPSGPALFLNGRGVWKRLPPDPSTGAWVGLCGDEVACIGADAPLAARLTTSVLLDADALADALAGLPRHDVAEHVDLMAWPWELIHRHLRAMHEPFPGQTPRGRHDGQVDAGSHLLNPEAITIEAGARVKPGVVIDAETGPVWIGPGVRVLPHVYIQGPAYIGAHSVLQPSAVVRDGTYIGPVCKVGGEIDASIIQGYSNKQHDGFLGHSYIGSWVNIAADCINSDLKNTYGTVRMPINGHKVETGEQFVGLIMGDHSKTAINVSFPTGSVIGCCSSIIVTIPPQFVPSFAWINQEGLDRYDVDRGVVLARRVMARRERTLTPAAEALFRHAAVVAQAHEVWEGG
ncbi:MAG: putative sugar nucleotidyl transferase [Bacteroidota bacterium]